MPGCPLGYLTLTSASTYLPTELYQNNFDILSSYWLKYENIRSVNFVTDPELNVLGFEEKSTVPSHIKLFTFSSMDESPLCKLSTTAIRFQIYVILNG